MFNVVLCRWDGGKHNASGWRRQKESVECWRESVLSVAEEKKVEAVYGGRSVVSMLRVWVCAYVLSVIFSSIPLLVSCKFCFFFVMLLLLLQLNKLKEYLPCFLLLLWWLNKLGAPLSANFVLFRWGTISLLSLHTPCRLMWAFNFVFDPVSILVFFLLNNLPLPFLLIPLSFSLDFFVFFLYIVSFALWLCFCNFCFVTLPAYWTVVDIT